MNYIDIASCKVCGADGGSTNPVVYVINSVEHPLRVSCLAGEISATIVLVPVRNWNDALTPWMADGLYRGEPPFGGCAAQTLAELCDNVVPSVERGSGLQPCARALCGYSLGGLFALYALVNTPIFDACACISGSVWYEGWVDYLRGATVDLTKKFAYLSVGTKEKRAARPILQNVQNNMEECARILETKGCGVRYTTGPGNHMQFVEERFLAGMSRLDEFMSGRSA